MLQRYPWLAGIAGLLLLGGALVLPTVSRGAAPTSTPTVAPVTPSPQIVPGVTPTVAPVTPSPQIVPGVTVTLPAPGQALIHEFTTSTGAICTVVLTATSSDPHPVCEPEPTPVTTPTR